MYVAQQERPDLFQATLSMERQAPVNGQTYPISSSTSQNPLPKMPRSPEEPGHVSCEDGNRIYRWAPIDQRIADLSIDHSTCPVSRSSNSQYVPECVDSETRLVLTLSPKNYGDSQDRRPITAPPCIKLIVTDAQSGKNIDIK